MATEADLKAQLAALELEKAAQRERELAPFKALQAKLSGKLSASVTESDLRELVHVLGLNPDVWTALGNAIRPVYAVQRKLYDPPQTD